MILLHLAVFLAGWTGIFGRVISLGGLPLVWYRSMVALAALAAVLALSRRLHRVPAADILRIAGCGALLGIHWVAFFASIKASNVSIGVACIATSCFFTAVFDPLVNRHRLSLKDFIISFIAIAGILLVFSLDVRYRLGIALGLLSAAVYSVFAILNIRAAGHSGQDSATMLLYELVGCVLFLAFCMPFQARLDPGTLTVPKGTDVWALLALGSVFTIIPFLLQIHALRNLSAFTVNVAYNLEPVYSILFAAVLFGETREVGLSFWLGIALIVISVFLQSRRHPS